MSRFLSFLRKWQFELGLLTFFLLLGAVTILPGVLLERSEPLIAPQNDPLVTMDHHNVLVCAQRHPEAPPPDQPTHVLTRFMGGTGGGQQLLLYSSPQGLCGVVDLTQFNNTPVQVALLPAKQEDYLSFTATFWEPTHKPEPNPAYDWATVALTEHSEMWWIQLTFRSNSQPMPSVTVGVE